MFNTAHRHTHFTLGDIGEEGEVIELEPFPESEPVQEPAAPTPAPAPEPVPA